MRLGNLFKVFDEVMVVVGYSNELFNLPFGGGHYPIQDLVGGGGVWLTPTPVKFLVVLYYSSQGFI